MAAVTNEKKNLKEDMTREERKEKEEELSARFLLKMIKIQQA